MSIRIMAQVWDAGPQSQSELLVLLALADFADDAGNCWPSMRRIAEKARVTERGAQKIVRRLEDAGYVKTVVGGGRNGCNQYLVTPNGVRPERCSPPEHGDGNPEPPFTPPPNGGSPEPSENHQEPSLVETPASILEPIAGREAVASFLAFRKRLRKPFTVTAAKLLAPSLQEIEQRGGDAAHALALCELKGWQAVKPDWYFREVSDGKSTDSNNRLQRIVAAAARGSSGQDWG